MHCLIYTITFDIVFMNEALESQNNNSDTPNLVVKNNTPN